MARPTKESLRFRNDLDALYLCVLLRENGFTAERVTEVIWDKFRLRMSEDAVDEWWDFWKNFGETRTKAGGVVE